MAVPSDFRSSIRSTETLHPSTLTLLSKSRTSSCQTLADPVLAPIHSTTLQRTTTCQGFQTCLARQVRLRKDFIKSQSNQLLIDVGVLSRKINPCVFVLWTGNPGGPGQPGPNQPGPGLPGPGNNFAQAQHPMNPPQPGPNPGQPGPNPARNNADFGGHDWQSEQVYPGYPLSPATFPTFPLSPASYLINNLTGFMLPRLLPGPGMQQLLQQGLRLQLMLHRHPHMPLSKHLLLLEAFLSDQW